MLILWIENGYQLFYQQPVDIFVNNLHPLCINYSRMLRDAVDILRHNPLFFYIRMAYASPLIFLKE